MLGKVEPQACLIQRSRRERMRLLVAFFHNGTPVVDGIALERWDCSPRRGAWKKILASELLLPAESG